MATIVIAAASAGVPARAGNGDGDSEDETFLGQPLVEEMLATGRRGYEERCASCHGAKLEGQPDWRRRLDDGLIPAPPHDGTGNTWHHSDRQLFENTKHGLGAVVPGYESAMPLFGGLLNDAEIVAVLALIKSTWPARQRDFQAEVTSNDANGK